MEKNERVVLLSIGILNIISGLLHIMLIFALSIFGFIAGISYFIFANGMFKKSIHKFRWLFYFVIIPLTILHWPLFIWLGTKKAPPGYHMNLIEQFIFIGIPLVTCLANICCLTHYKVKGQECQSCRK